MYNTILIQYNGIVVSAPVTYIAWQAIKISSMFNTFQIEGVLGMFLGVQIPLHKVFGSLGIGQVTSSNGPIFQSAMLI